MKFIQVKINQVLRDWRENKISFALAVQCLVGLGVSIEQANKLSIEDANKLLAET